MLQSGVDYFEAEVGVLGQRDVGASHHHCQLVRAGGEGEGAAVRRVRLPCTGDERSRCLSQSSQPIWESWRGRKRAATRRMFAATGYRNFLTWR